MRGQMNSPHAASVVLQSTIVFVKRSQVQIDIDHLSY